MWLIIVLPQQVERRRPLSRLVAERSASRFTPTRAAHHSRKSSVAVRGFFTANCPLSTRRHPCDDLAANLHCGALLHRHLIGGAEDGQQPVAVELDDATPARPHHLRHHLGVAIDRVEDLLRLARFGRPV